MTEHTPDWLVPSAITGRQLREAAQHVAASYQPDQLETWQYHLDLAPAAVRIRRTSTLPPGPRREDQRSRSTITAWSLKSRTNLIWRLATLDYAPMLDGGCLPMLLTLTYPGDWQTVAPNGQATKRHLAAFRRRFERKFGPIHAVWVLEWQRSGAPHLHLMLAIEVVRQNEVRAWIASTWADIVAHPDPEQRRRHERAGTQLKHSEHGLNPRVAAIYFVKHAAPGKTSKAYQKRPPQLWKDAGSIGRLWGYWGLSPLTETAPISRANATQLARNLRKWDQRKRGPQRVRVMRVRDDTGEVRWRWKYRPAKPRLTAISGFLTLPDPLHLLRRASVLPSEADTTVESGRGHLDRNRTIQRRGGTTLLGQIRDSIKRAAVRADVLARLVLRRLRSARHVFRRR